MAGEFLGERMDSAVASAMHGDGHQYHQYGNREAKVHHAMQEVAHERVFWTNEAAAEVQQLQEQHLAMDTAEAATECCRAAVRHAAVGAGLAAAIEDFEFEHEDSTAAMSRAARAAYGAQHEVLQAQQQIDATKKKFDTAEKEYENLKERARRLAEHVAKQAERHNLKYGVHPWLETACEQVKKAEEKVAQQKEVVEALRIELEEDIAIGKQKTSVWEGCDQIFHNAKVQSEDSRDMWGIAATHHNIIHGKSHNMTGHTMQAAQKKAFAPHNLDTASLAVLSNEIAPPEGY